MSKKWDEESGPGMHATFAAPFFKQGNKIIKENTMNYV